MPTIPLAAADRDHIVRANECLTDALQHLSWVRWDGLDPERRGIVSTRNGLTDVLADDREPCNGYHDAGCRCLDPARAIDPFRSVNVDPVWYAKKKLAHADAVSDDLHEREC